MPLPDIDVTDIDVIADASDLAETWLRQLTRLPRSSWLDPVRILLEKLPQAIEQSGGNIEDLADADHTLQSLIPAIGSLFRQHRNESLPVFRLPAEILGEIFLYVRYMHNPDWRDHTSMAIDWIRVCTHVCHKWREVCTALF